MICDDTPDFLYPLYADIYYPVISQGLFNEIKKEWIYGKTITCYAASALRKSRSEIEPEAFIHLQDMLSARSKADIRKNGKGGMESLANILVTNIRSSADEIIYSESAGPRAGRGTIYEVSRFDPFLGPFGNVEYYSMLWRRTENQEVSE